uniref:UBX domain-containing protein n=1 Tax=Steinernema glaseri TaxID=37863 RepID=A0A1I8AIJ8_9BILA
MEQNGDNPLVAQFKEVCAVPDDVAVQFLQHHNWNLEEALHTFFRNDGILPQNGHSELRRRNIDSPSTSESFTEDIDLYRDRENSTSDLGSSTDDEYEESPYLSASLNCPYWPSTISSLVSVSPPFIYGHLMKALSVYLFRHPALSVSDPRGDVASFIQRFNEKYCANGNGVEWYSGSYNDVLQESKNALRFVLVYLHGEHHQNTDEFVREKLLSGPARTFYERNNLLMWGASVRSAEGYKVSMNLRNTTYPFLALIGMRDNRMAMLAKAEGEHDLEPMLYTMQTAIDENIGHFNAVREARLQRDIDSQLRREQELEYERALAADRAKENERKRVESERLEAERKEQEERDAILKKKQSLEEMKSKIRNTLPEEPSAASDECIRVNIRFPSGQKMERRFLSSDTLEALFNVTLCHESCPDDFSLLSSYPRKQLNCHPSWYRAYGSGDMSDSPIPTFAEAGFPKASVVLVQDNEA